MCRDSSFGAKSMLFLLLTKGFSYCSFIIIILKKKTLLLIIFLMKKDFFSLCCFPFLNYYIFSICRVYELDRIYFILFYFIYYDCRLYSCITHITQRILSIYRCLDMILNFNFFYLNIRDINRDIFIYK